MEVIGKKNERRQVNEKILQIILGNIGMVKKHGRQDRDGLYTMDSDRSPTDKGSL